MERLYSMVGSMVLGFSAVALMACNGTSVIGGGEGGGTSAASGGDGPSCLGSSPLATPEELAATPRADADAELLALQAAETFVAPDDVYDRVLSDLQHIRAGNPVTANIGANPDFFFASAILVGLDTDGYAALMAHTYTEWDCLNAYYGGTLGQVFTIIPTAVINFNGRFDTRMLVKEYEKLTHVRAAEVDGIVGDGSTVCASIDGATYSYIFDSASGDCPAGCDEHTYFGFSTTPGGAITSLGTFTYGQGDPPAWFLSLPACTKQF